MSARELVRCTDCGKFYVAREQANGEYAVIGISDDGCVACGNTEYSFVRSDGDNLDTDADER